MNGGRSQFDLRPQETELFTAELLGSNWTVDLLDTGVELNWNCLMAKMFDFMFNPDTWYVMVWSIHYLRWKFKLLYIRQATIYNSILYIFLKYIELKIIILFKETSCGFISLLGSYRIWLARHAKSGPLALVWYKQNQVFMLSSFQVFNRVLVLCFMFICLYYQCKEWSWSRNAGE